MKKITLLVCLLTIAFVNAQDEDKDTSDKLNFTKGTHFVNANFAIGITESKTTSETRDNDGKNVGFSIGTSYSYAVSDNLFIGLGVAYAHSKQTSQSNIIPVENESKSTSLTIMPYVRYYKGIGKKVALFIQGETRYTKSETEFNFLNGGDSDTFFFGVRPGITLMLNKNLALETTIGALGYTTSKTENETNASETDLNSFNFSLNASNLLFGLSYFF